MAVIQPGLFLIMRRFPDHKDVLRHRFTIVEPVFANIKTQKRLDRYTLGGKIKVNVQWMLYCMVHNLESILKKGSVPTAL